jgi:hypothetical protein
VKVDTLTHYDLLFEERLLAQIYAPCLTVNCLLAPLRHFAYSTGFDKVNEFLKL